MRVPRIRAYDDYACSAQKRLDDYADSAQKRLDDYAEFIAVAKAELPDYNKHYIYKKPWWVPRRRSSLSISF